MTTKTSSSSGTSTSSSSSSEHMLSLLDEDDTTLQVHALNYLNDNAHRFWHEMAPQIAKIETLYEDEKFPKRELAAVVASKVFYHLSDLDDALKYALGAAHLFDVTLKTEYVQTLIAKCIDEYTRLRVINDELREGKNGGKEGEQKIDDRLVAVVERMFDRCFNDGHFKQAIGVALETRRLDVLQKAIVTSGDVGVMTDYTFHQAQKVVVSRKFRQEVLKVLVNIYKGSAKPDYIQMCQCLLFLNESQTVADVLDGLVRPADAPVTGVNADDNLLMAYQVAFDLQENQNQPFLNAVIAALPTPAGATSATPTATTTPAAATAATPTPAAATATPATAAPTETKEEEDNYANRMIRLKSILSGDVPVNVHLNYLYGQNKTDLNILKLIKDKLEQRNSVLHNATVMAHAIMHVGTTSDTFLRDNLEWLAKATNWAKFTATASIGVIHKGHHKESQRLLQPYLPQAGQTGSPYQEGGALYALGLIHANHGTDQVEFLMTALRNSGTNEIVQHGACLGLGLAAMATNNRTIYDYLKTSVLFTENAVAGEAAALAMGLVLLGTANGAALEEMLAYAHDTRHEKIIRGIAMGLALIVYGVEEQADVLIEQLLGDKDPLLRYGGMYAIAMAYCGTSNNTAIRRLLHSAVSDVSDDVRRAAVTGLGFVLCNKPDEVPRIVNLLSESYNSHVRYGAALAIGIACAGTGNKDALNVLEPLCKDRVDLTRQGALIATAMVLIQHNDVKEPKVKTFRKTLADAQLLKGDTMTKLGAILAAGVLDAGGRNVTMSLLSPAGHKKMAAVVGMAMFPQFWYWYPYIHFVSLAFSPTAVIGLGKGIKMPKSFTFVSNARPSLFALPPDVEIKKVEEKKVIKTATLSVTAKAKAKAKKKGVDGTDMDTGDDKTPAATPRPGDTPKDSFGSTDVKLGEGAASAAKKDTDGDVSMNTEDKKASVVSPADKKDGPNEDKKADEDKKAIEEKKPEAESEVLQNPSRVTWAQQKYISYDNTQRYQPIKSKLWGIVMLRDTQPGEAEDFVVAKPPKVGIPGVSDDEPEPPAAFEYLA